MNSLTAYHKLARLYRDAFKVDPASPENVLRWAESPELWAEQQIRYRNWGWHAVEAVVRNCRALRNRAAMALAEGLVPSPPPASGEDPFDPLMPEQEPRA
jgi:hypothetical protein